MNVKACVKTERKRVTLPIVTRGFMVTTGIKMNAVDELLKYSKNRLQSSFFIPRNIPDQVMSLC